MIILDACLVAGSFILSYDLCYGWRLATSISGLTWYLVLFVVLWIFFLYLSGMYASFRLKKLSEVLFILYQTAYLSFLIFVSICYLFKVTVIQRPFVFLAFFYAVVFLSIEKVVLRLIFKNLRKRGFNKRYILVAGTGERARHFIRWIGDNREFGLKIIGLVDCDESNVGKCIEGHEIIGTFEDIPAIHRRHVLDSVLFTVPYTMIDKIERPMNYLETVGLKMDIALDYFGRRLAKARQSEFCGVPILTFQRTPERLLALSMKRLFDIVFSMTALVASAPLLGVVALLVKATSKGPVLFVHERYGLNGRKFRMYKFRTMVEDAARQQDEMQKKNEMIGPGFKIVDDPRITPLGKWLRKFSIDELPQFWNVLKGDMSLVGPRPAPHFEVKNYDDWHLRRLRMRPGLTCLWQVKGRNNIMDFDRRADLDLQYIDNWSLWLDFKILLKTVPVVLFGIGAK